MDPKKEILFRYAMMVVSAGIIALGFQFMFRLGQMVYQEVYLCGGLC